MVLKLVQAMEGIKKESVEPPIAVECDYLPNVVQRHTHDSRRPTHNQSRDGDRAQPLLFVAAP